MLTISFSILAGIVSAFLLGWIIGHWMDVTDIRLATVTLCLNCIALLSIGLFKLDMLDKLFLAGVVPLIGLYGILELFSQKKFNTDKDFQKIFRKSMAVLLVMFTALFCVAINTNTSGLI